MKKETYKIKGMHCASCAGTIERVLLKMAGVRSVSVNFASESALVEFDENIVSESDLVKAVESVGYELDIGIQEKKLRSKLIVGGIFSVFIFLGSFPQLTQALADWTPIYAEILRPLSNYWVLLILATPVQLWVGWQFYAGLKLLVKYRTADMNTLIAIGTLAAHFYSAAVTVFPSFFVS